MKPTKLHVPLLNPIDVKPHLGKPDLHWKEGRSAHSLANHWFRCNALPSDISEVLKTEACFRGAELLDAFFERDTRIGDSGRCSQTDLLAVLGLRDGTLAILGVEAKVSEPFGNLISDERTPSLGVRKQTRIVRLAGELGLNPDSEIFGDLRYQLLHRTAAALYEARRYRTRRAIMLVETFSSDDLHFGDYERFTKALGGRAKKGALSKVSIPGDIELWLGWCNSSAKLGSWS